MLHKQRGSLIINLGIALALILFLLSMSLPSISFMRRFLLHTELEKLYNIFYYLQQRAIATNQDHLLHFDIQNNRFYTDILSEQLPSGLRFDFLPGAHGPPSSPTKPITSPITFKKNRVVFYADGTITAGTIYLVDHDHNSMYALTSPISQISFVRIYHYSKGSWALLK